MGRPTKNYQKQHHLNQNMVDDTPLIAKGEPNRGKKQGHRVLCCCDSRKGTMLVNLVALILSILGLVSVSINYKNTGDYWAIVILSISVLFWLSVVWGALRYHRCAVFIAMLWAIASLVLIIIGTVQYDWDTVSEEDKPYSIAGVTILMVWWLVVIYADAVFISEVSNGIMSPETHSREKYSCCCNV